MAMIEIPGYQIVKPLGRGGMAVVYLAIQESLDRHVALKVLARHLSGEDTFNDRFLREARIAARFLHRSIVQIHDINAHDGRPYMAMEYLPGGTLGARLANMTLKAKLVVAAEIADALDFMHRQSFIHRDVKPDNIIFRADDSAVITDFGIARAANSVTRMTLTGSILGTPHYMSPEQARGKKIDSRSDLYSLGVVLFAMLTGRLPYDAEDQFSICAMHVNEPIPKLPDDVAYLQAVVDRLLAKDPDDRFQTGRELYRELEAAADTRLLPRRTTGMSIETAVVGTDPQEATRVGVGKVRTSTGPTEVSEPEVHPTDDDMVIDKRLRDSDALPRRSPFRPNSLWALLRPLATISLKWLALLRIRLNVVWRSLQRQLGVLHSTWFGETGIFRHRTMSGRHLRQPAVWAPMAAIAVSLGGIAWTLVPEPSAEPESSPLVAESGPPTSRSQPIETVEPEVKQDAATSKADLVSAVQGFAQQASTATDWLWLRRLRALLAEDGGEIDASEWPAVPERGELEIFLLNQLDQPKAPSLADMAEATHEKWQTLAPGLSWQPTESRLLNELEQLARAATSGRLAIALESARKGQWEGSDGAWSRFEQIYPLVPSRNQRESAMSELRLVWLNQWKSLMDTPDFDAANAFYENAFEAEVLGEEWLIQKSRQLSELEQTLEEAAANDRIASLLEEAERALEDDRLMVPAGNNAYEAYQSVLEQNPEHPEARAGIRRVAERYAELARLALDRSDFDNADQFISRARRLAPDLAQLPELTEWRDSLSGTGAATSGRSSEAIQLPSLDLRGDEPAGRLIDQGESALRANRTLEGYAYLLAALREDPDNRTARRRLDQRAQRYIRLATRDIANGALDEARRNLGIVNQIAPDHPDYAAADRALLNALDRARAQSSASSETQSNLNRLRLSVMLTEASANLDRLAADPANQRLALQAAEKIEQAQRIDGRNSQVEALQSRQATVLEQAARRMLDEGSTDLARWYIDQLTQVDPGNETLSELQQQLTE
jgi:serine/threonine protein kinase/tetratricopeptide (TPR) repeat protein